MPAAPDRQLVALRLPPGEEFIEALDDAWAAGNAVLPVDPKLPAARVDELLAAMRLDQPVDEATALVIATSGSTGVPKGVELSHAAVEASIDACHARIGREPGDVWLSCLPWHGIGGLQVMLRARRLGIRLVVIDAFDRERLAAADGTLTSLVPAQLALLLDAGIDLTRFRVILLGGAAASPELLDDARRAGANVVTTYGMSETSGGCVYDGAPLDGVQVEAEASGRLRVRGPMLMSGYRGRSDLTDKALVDGWLLTADRGAVSADGSVSVLGRIDDVIITGGKNVAAAAVMSAIGSIQAVKEVAVIGADDPVWGQRVVAAIVVHPGSAVPDLDTIRQQCDGLLTSSEQPRQLLVLDELPYLSTGKIDRLALQRLAAAG